jgi:hypothetical protein
MSVHAAKLAEPTTNYTWESLKAADFEAGAAKGFKYFSEALREYAIAGSLHLQHMASIPGSIQYELIKRRSSNELAESLAVSPAEVLERLDRVLKQHAREWASFVDDLGPNSFVKKWVKQVS